jgi:hypothetical protein
VQIETKRYLQIDDSKEARRPEEKQLLKILLEETAKPNTDFAKFKVFWRHI